MAEPNQDTSIAKKIYDDRGIYINYAIKDLYRSRNEAIDLLKDVVVSILENNTYNQNRGSLNFFVKLRMKSRHKDIIQKKTNEKYALSINTEFNYSNIPNHMLPDIPLTEKENIFDLIEDPIKTYGNFKNKIIITTIKPHKALVGYAVKIRGLNGIPTLTEKRLSNALGDEIYISDIIDEKNIVIKVNFDHEISSTKCGGQNTKVVIKNVNNSFQSNETLEILCEGKEEETAIDHIAIKELEKICLGKLNSKERLFFKANMTRNITGRNLGTKSSDPIMDNDELELKIGDIYSLRPKSSDETEEQAKENKIIIKIFNGNKWEIIENNSALNKPLTTERITLLYNLKFKTNMAVGTVGEILAKAKRSFGECMNNARYANG